MTKLKQKSYRPPKYVLSNVQRGLGLKKKWGRGGCATAVGTMGASFAGLAKGVALPLSEIQAMKAYFDSHDNSFNPDYTEADGGPDEGTINWLLCGGSAGKRWASRVIEQEMPMEKNFDYRATVCKVDESLGLVMGYAIISKQNGEDYYDLQGDHIPEDAMLKAAVDFMSGARTVGEMHETEEGGTVVFAWPLTTEIAKAFNLETDTTGLMIAIKPKCHKTLEKFKDGTYNGFSIGGIRITDEEVEDE